MNDKNISNLTEEIKKLKETIIELNKNFKVWIEDNFLSVENTENEILPELKPFPSDHSFELENTDCPDYITKEFIEIQKQMIPILKEWIKEHKKGDE